MVAAVFDAVSVVVELALLLELQLLANCCCCY